MKVMFPESKIYRLKEINMEVFEQGQGFPLVLAHGFPELAYSWRFQIPVLAEAGYRVIVPNQRGYGETDKPKAVEAYDMSHLCGDMASLLDVLNLEKAVFIGHDWGSVVVWNMPLYHPEKVAGVVGMSVPFSPRGNFDPLPMLEQFLGSENYIVHFNRKPGVADAAFAANPKQFFTNVFRHKQWVGATRPLPGNRPGPAVSLMSMLEQTDPRGEPLMSEEEMDVFITAFNKGGFTGPINWYRNISRNWEISADLPQAIDVPCAMIHGTYDIVPKGRDVLKFIPNLESITLDCGHWIQQEKVDEVNAFLVDWLKLNFPS
jgi:pimeloyl-ACP methyl ester carboxylesterase